MSDDDTHLKATCLLSSISNIHMSSRIFGKNMTSVSSWKNWMMQVGFSNVQEVVYNVCETVFETGRHLADRNKASAKSLVYRPQSPRAWEIPATQDARGAAIIHIRTLHPRAWVATCRN
jgi:hypothetical protein